MENNERKDGLNEFYHRHVAARDLHEAERAALQKCHRCANYYYCGMNRGTVGCGSFVPKTLKNN